MSYQPNTDLPVSFRAEIVKPIMQRLAAGDSCSVVGIGSVGKSNLLRFLLREDVRQTYLSADWATYLLVYVDTNKILKQSWWGLLELMLYQLRIELETLVADEAMLERINALHRQATTSNTRQLALRYLDQALRIVCAHLGLYLVFIIDEFDQLCRTMSPQGFNGLRALRDEFKYKLMYVVATRLELKRLRENSSDIEAFEELVAPQTIWLGPYSEPDARFTLRRLGQRHGLALDSQTELQVLLATGGHPGLLREGYNVAAAQPNDLLKALAGQPEVQDECQRLWFSLSPEEQHVMTSLANGPLAEPDQLAVVERLRHKGLVGGPWVNNAEIFSPLLAAYIKQQQPVVGAQIYVDHARRVVWVNGQRKQGLSRLEYELMAYLEEKREQVCSRDDIANHIYPHEINFGDAGITDNRIDALIKRLRKQIEPDPKNPRYIVTVRGQGFCLVDGDQPEP